MLRRSQQTQNLAQCDPDQHAINTHSSADQASSKWVYVDTLDTLAQIADVALQIVQRIVAVSLQQKNKQSLAESERQRIRGKEAEEDAPSGDFRDEASGCIA